MEGKLIATVSDANIGKSSKDKKSKIRGYSGVSVTFTTDDHIESQALLAIEGHWFEAHSMNITDDNKLEIEAHEVGYYVHKFDRKKDFDMRTLIGKDIQLVLDEATKRKIHEESCWC